MSEYLCVNSVGKACGLKLLSDSMAERLEKGGWTLVPVSSIGQTKAQVVKR